MMSVRLFEHFNKALRKTFSLKTGNQILPCVNKHKIPMGSKLPTWRFWMEPMLKQLMWFSSLSWNECKVSPYECYFSFCRWLLHLCIKASSTQKQCYIRQFPGFIHSANMHWAAISGYWTQWYKHEEDSVLHSRSPWPMVWFRKLTYKQIMMIQVNKYNCSHVLWVLREPGN